ncbi:EAL domain-containing protein [Oryzomicrobium sp.]|uniref:EAL domain-containing protein n=1 Tax=Oryzomicrobium sp. TaxID=1911578 RepID=UPI0025FE9644|nr:EAL domain-containing protein [Oryzomicrobium sp.]MCE1242453.1 EAL domain-containing protein [Oryzomicrobium sp.]
MHLLLKYDGQYAPPLWQALGAEHSAPHVWRFTLPDAPSLDGLMETLAAETNQYILQQTFALIHGTGAPPTSPGDVLGRITPFNTLYARRLHSWLEGDLAPYIRMHFQPLVDLAQGGEIFAFEALCRLQDPQGRLLSGADAFRLAAQLQREADLDLECQRLALAAKAGAIPADKLLFINVLPRNLMHQGWMNSLSESLEHLGIDRRQVVIEVVESERADPAMLAQSCDALRTRGFRIALDDMGSGFNGLSTLAAVRADFIKVDRAIVHGAQGSKVRSVLLEAIVSMAQRLGATVIAEGLERAEDITFVRDMGIGYAQGYYFAPPRAEVITAVTPLPGLDESCLSRAKDRFALTDLMDPGVAVEIQEPLEAVRRLFADNPSLALAVVTDDAQPIGLVRRGRVLSSHASKTLGKLSEPLARSLPSRLTSAALARVLYHDRKDADPWVVTSPDGRYQGMIHPMTLIAQLLARRENGNNLHPLSQLPTGPSLRLTLDSRLAQGQELCLVYIDLDNFKAYNDRYGFIRGDAMIRSLAELLRYRFGQRKDCLLGHIGGDDFVLIQERMPAGLVPELLDIMSQFHAIAAHLYDHDDVARGHFVTEDGSAYPIASMSVAVVTGLGPDGTPLPSSLAAAERAAALKKIGKVAEGSVVVVDGTPPALHRESPHAALRDWTDSALEALRALEEAPRSKDPHALDLAFRTSPYFEMVFELDGAGMQRYPNWINPEMYGRIKAGGMGADRSAQAYFAEVRDTGRPFVSPIYLSTASEDFCLTLAVPLADGQGRFDGALVADINIGALAALLRREAAPA